MNENLRKAMKHEAECRAKLNELLSTDKKDVDEAEYRAASEALAKASQALIEAIDADAAAPTELRDRISLARYMQGIADESVPDGAERELRQELKLGDNSIPLEALLPTPEERADAVSPQNAAGNAALGFGTINQTTGPMLNRVFTATDAAFLGVAMPTVPAGERVYPVMTGGTTAAMEGRGDDAPDAGAATFDVVNATPHRLSARYVFDLEGVATLGAALESTLRADLRTVMGYYLDLQILNGTGKNDQVEGLLTTLPLTLPPGETFSGNDVSAQPTWSDFKTAIVGGVDGAYARTEADLRILFGNATWQLMRTLYRGNGTDNQDAVSALRELGAMLGRSFQIPAPSKVTISPKTTAATKLTQRSLVNKEPAAAVAPVWQGITMIRDPYSNARKAQIVMTAHMLFDFVLRRKAGWAQWAIRTEK